MADKTKRIKTPKDFSDLQSREKHFISLYRQLNAIRKVELIDYLVKISKRDKSVDHVIFKV